MHHTQKSKRLAFEFYKIISPEKLGCMESRKKAIECAKKHVDDIIKYEPRLPITASSFDYEESAKLSTEYWKKVRTDLNQIEWQHPLK